MRVEIRISGIGGQGSVLASTILANAVGVHDGKEAIQTQEYEAAIRGGRAVGDCVTDTETIVYPWVIEPNILVAQHRLAVQDHVPHMAAGGTLIFDTVFFDGTIDRTDIRAFGVPMTKLSDDAGLRRSANMLSLGVLSSLTGVVSPDALRKSVEDFSPGTTAENNLRALELGLAVDRAAVARSA
jgi:2-oxoglutarate ferredoxin oxidoreductase subunit gamma